MLIFQNPGLIEIEAVTTLGVSVKDGESPIGRFGTGFKFAISTILRAGGSVVVWRGLEAFRFASETQEVRGRSFDFVTMNGQRLGFTTQLGRDWQKWMAFRELASNCRDEAGRYWLDESTGLPGVKLGEDQTTIVVNGLDEIWPERGTILLEGEALWTSESGQAFAGSSDFAFYRGVRIFNLPRPSTFTYNVDGPVLELTEDRTAKNFWQLELAVEKIVGACPDPQQARQLLTGGERTWEHHMDIHNYGAPKEVFRAAARELALGSEAMPTMNPQAMRAARASAIQDMTPGDAIRLDEVKQAMLTRALAMLTAGGLDVDAFPLIVTDTLGTGIAGLAQDGKIFLSLIPFEKGTREVAATLLEEFAHLRSGAADCTRPFQNWLIDQLLIRLERAAGAPF